MSKSRREFLTQASLALAGAAARRVPHGVTLIGRLFDEGTLGRAGLALERFFGVIGERPPGF